MNGCSACQDGNKMADKDGGFRFLDESLKFEDMQRTTNRLSGKNVTRTSQ